MKNIIWFTKHNQRRFVFVTCLKLRIVMRKSFFIILLAVVVVKSVNAQTGVLKGVVSELRNNEPIIGATIQLIGKNIATISELDGSYIFENLNPGLYDIEVSYLGYETINQFEIEVQGVRPTTLNFLLTQSAKQLDEVVIKTSSFKKTSESPVSLRTIGVSEIRRNPGGNRDISRVIQSLPGVTSTASFRNDLIIRGGAPNENRFFIDDVEVPNINHFATQGASGGPAGLINIDFIREVDFFGSAFPASRGNALSSVFNFKLKEGRDDRLGLTATAGATDVGVTLDGPINKNTTFLVSARRSYLQFLFKAIGLPFLPTYTDFNAKVKVKLDKKSEIYFIGIGAIDDFVLNTDANDTESKQFILNQLPINTQWNYTNGVVYKRYRNSGFTSFILSRNMLNNEAVKYLNNNDSSRENLILDYKSQEIENKLRIENTSNYGLWTLITGVGYEFVKYNNNTENKIFTPAGPLDIKYSSAIQFQKYGVFGSLGRKLLNEKLNISMGLRLDGNSFSTEMSNPLSQLSPRLAISYAITERISYNFNIGRYYQLPPYTSIGYRDGNSVLVNKMNGIKYISSDHFVTGFEFNTSTSARFTVEGYYKKYANYPFLIREQISLANLGGDFGVIGAEPVLPNSEGRTYGVEFLYQQRLFKGFYGIAAYTLGFSEFKDQNGVFRPSSWDSRNIVNLTLGKRFESNWEIGAKWRFQSGLPFSPFSEDSDLVVNWERNGRGIPDYTQLNTLRTNASSVFDLRVDKKWFFKRWELNLYLDLQNLTSNTVNRDALILDRPLDDEGLPIGEAIISNPDAPLSQQRFLLKRIGDNNGTLLPTLGVVISL